MRDKSHAEQIERWARYFKENPMNARRKLNFFIDAQIKKAREFYIRLEKVKGKEFVLNLQRAKK